MTEEDRIRHDERKKIIAQGCIHTRKASENADYDRPDLSAWQEDQSEYFDPTILEIVSEYAAWRDQAEVKQNPVQDFIQYVAKVSEAIGFQAGVGGRETAGAIIGFLAQHPDQLEVFMKEGVFGWDDTEWITGGCLTWQANDGKVWHPDDARAARDAAQSAQGDR